MCVGVGVGVCAAHGEHAQVLTLVQDGMAAAAFTGDFLLAAKEVSDAAMVGVDPGAGGCGWVWM